MLTYIVGRMERSHGITLAAAIDYRSMAESLSVALFIVLDELSWPWVNHPSSFKYWKI